MRLFNEAFLDRMEPRFTGINTRRRKYLSKLAWLFPRVTLQPEQPYPLKAYIKSSLIPVVAMGAVYSLAYTLPLGYLWFLFPHVFLHILFSHSPLHAALIGGLSQTGFYLLPYVLLSWLAFSFLLGYPRYYFWNRRAARLKKEALDSPVIVEKPALNSDAWPPMPVV